jgi:two-component system, chemotaxis family, chemotaxis protein CheY
VSYTILVVDDSPIARAVLRKVIAMSGVDVGRVLEAGDGAEALEVLGRESVDLVLADVNMPRLGGPDLVRRLRATPALAGTPVVMVSSERSRARQDELRRNGVRAYLTKPCRPEQLREVLVAVLPGAAGGPRAG